MSLRRWIACWALALVAACGGSENERAARAPEGSAQAVPPPSASRAGASQAAAAAAWEDPEPAGAQALAESVLAAEWNRDKRSQLEMTITTLDFGRTSGLVGLATELAAKSTSVDERLTRLGAEITETEITIRLPGSILFDFDSADLRPDAERTLEELAQVLLAYAPRPARIEGHTDSIASDDYNQGLSERRAQSVARWLTNHGVAASRLESAGRGETQPVADNATAAGRQRNRRVEIIIAKSG